MTVARRRVREEDAAGGAADAAAGGHGDRQCASRPAPPQPVTEPVPVPPSRCRKTRSAAKSLDDLNRDSPLKPVFFELDSSDLSARRAGDAAGRTPAC